MGQGLTGAGWIFLILGWGVIIGLAVYCFSRVLFGKKKTLSAGGEPGRDRWASRVGLILAMAGNAIGLGNFLRFPVQAASNGGGAFMIPYFIALLLLGIPMMWVEWTIGRFGGVRGHGTTPGMFAALWKHPGGQVPRLPGDHDPVHHPGLLRLHRVVVHGVLVVLPDRPVLRRHQPRGHGPFPAGLPGSGEHRRVPRRSSPLSSSWPSRSGSTTSASTGGSPRASRSWPRSACRCCSSSASSWRSGS